MNEYQRMQYLEAMGIETFVPRMRLVNAKLSLQCVLPEPSLQIQANTGSVKSAALVDALTDASAETPAKEGGLSQQMLRDLNSSLNAPSDSRTGLGSGSGSGSGQISKHPRAEAQNIHSVDTQGVEPVQAHGRSAGTSADNHVVRSSETSPSTSPSSTDISHTGETVANKVESQNASFNLALWFIPDCNIQVVDSRQPQDALPTEALLTNILVATEFLKAGLPVAELQSWPLLGSDDLSWAAASSFLNDFLSYRFQTKPAKAFLLFGEDAAKAVLGERFDFENQLFSKVPVDEYKVHALVLPSLRDLLYAPQSKRQLWSLLTSLFHT